MKPRDVARGQQLDDVLRDISENVRILPGIQSNQARAVLIDQLLESIRRVEFVRAIRGQNLSEARADPSSDIFDPLRAAVLHSRKSNLDEAFWLTFLATHFGRHLKDHWRLARDIYGGYGGAGTWTWVRVISNLAAFEGWVGAQFEDFKVDGIPRRFGNHRKYETLRPDSNRSTGKIIKSYVEWIGPNRGHALAFQEALIIADQDRKIAFDRLYNSMKAVLGFGRTGRFDYLTMVGKLGLADIEPGSPYLQGSTGPLKGAELLFGGNESVATLDGWTTELGIALGVGMQVMEDALCNWQKSPKKFIAFRG